jgi:hypothetical protein
MDIEARVRPGKNALGPLGAQKILADQKSANFPPLSRLARDQGKVFRNRKNIFFY